jgi:mannosyl-3-phosphoglycerate phosphatase
VSWPLLIATDVDGSLLDEQSYSFEPARPALLALERAGALLVLASSKTREELVPLSQRLGTRPGPLIVENGGALLVPDGASSAPVAGASRVAGYDQLGLGTPRAALISALAAIADETGSRIRGFSSLSAEAVTWLTGLSRYQARRALAREWDEPFLVEPGEVAAVSEAARKRGLVVTRGGRFHHLQGPGGKGVALSRLLSLLACDGRRFETVALGDSENDLSMLERVDRPILVPRPGGSCDEILAVRLPAAERAPAPGAAGWNAAVLGVLGTSA